MIYSYQEPTLMLIYGAGFTVIYALFFFMYLHAERNAESLELTPTELFITTSNKWAHFFMVLIGLTTIIIAYLLPPENAGISGFFYLLIPVTHTAWYSYRGAKERKMLKRN